MSVQKKKKILYEIEGIEINCINLRDDKIVARDFVLYIKLTH